ncbi:M20 metallopeptidase family protein [Fusibacter ferrireducens]|uniref:Amidohydrolase n=1 Tax=Fusibacter ferrireducens TaxID=2785058 RepID=A0ABR9ZWN4_9FIRM|nr:M20 family metallopeptidase [Fusibacter ferrireducens]MBF4694290.1 amidohydrolase [Fusibacter ferrireducens]
MSSILESAKALQEELLQHRQKIHQNPELGMALPKTCEYVKNQLKEMGVDVTEYGNSAFSALIGDPSKGKVVLLRADMDALPIKEETDVPFASTNGCMHACGHDIHTTMLLGAAKVLKMRENELKGAVKLMFQPGEETLEGAKYMVAQGVLENPKVDAAMMIHVVTGIPLPSGYIIIPNAGASSAASDTFEIVVNGKGGHGAMPESSVDPLNIISHIHLSLQAIISREIPAAESAVVTVGVMQGGTTFNVIPDTASMKGTVRTFDEDTRIFIERRIGEIASGTAALFRATASTEYVKGCPSVVNDESLVHQMYQTIGNQFGKEFIVPMASAMPGGKMMGSEDFSFVTQKVPSVMIALSMGNSEEGYAYPMHHPKAKFDQKDIYKGAAIYAQFALDCLNQK